MMKWSSFFVFCTFQLLCGCASQWDLNHLAGVYHGEKRWAQPEPGDLFPSVKYEVDVVLAPDSTFELHQWHVIDSGSVRYWGNWTLEDSLVRLNFKGTTHLQNGAMVHISFDENDHFVHEMGGYLRITGRRELTGTLTAKWESVTINRSE